MSLILFSAEALKAKRRSSWALDPSTFSIRPTGSGAAIRLTRKSVALVLLLASKRLDAGAGASMGWVELWEIANLKEWTGARTTASLAAQVRREIKGLHRICSGLVETPPGSRLRGPFRLACIPKADRLLQDILASIAPANDAMNRTSESLYAWLEGTEPVWRSFHYFDKPGEALSSLPAVDDSISRDPLVRALLHIGSAKRLREVGAYRKAKQALELASHAAREEPHLSVREHLQALCMLQHAWLTYRGGNLDETERCLANADMIATSRTHLKLRAQCFSLRSLVRRSKRLYSAALEDLWHAARLFVVEGDLFQLFAVYHNLACLIAAEAAEQPDASRRRGMFRQALTYSQRNEVYCRQYGIGHNSVLNKLLQVGLHRELGEPDLALQVAGDAERLALDSQNFPDAMKAHRHRLSLLLERQLLREAKQAHEATVDALRDSELKRQCARIYEEELARLSVSSAPASGSISRQPRRGRRTPGA